MRGTSPEDPRRSMGTEFVSDIRPRGPDDHAEDKTSRARQNVVHETGLFQGRLGFARAVVLVEEGVEGFSNLNGIQQIQFSQDNIREAFGDVLATIKREFPDRRAQQAH